MGQIVLTVAHDSNLLSKWRLKSNCKKIRRSEFEIRIEENISNAHAKYFKMETDHFEKKTVQLFGIKLRAQKLSELETDFMASSLFRDVNRHPF
jgi:hypothetical protein